MTEVKHIWKYFKDEDWDCPCGCGERVRPHVAHRLDLARFFSGVPYRLTSGMRCKTYNATIKGASPTSSHTKGLAVDIKFYNSYEKFKIVEGLMRAGFTRIGINDKLSFIHADLDEDKPQNVMFKY